MNCLRPVIGLLVLAMPGVAGDVSGRVLITKRLTKRAVSPAVYNLRGPAATLTSAGSQGLINDFEKMVVFLEGGMAPAPPPETAVMEQLNGHFEPDLLVIPVGSKVEFPNSDPIFHNVFSLSSTQPFDLGYFPKGQSRTVKFNRGGIVQVYCHIHAQMYAAIVVADSPWHSKPSADGTFSWTNVPPGHYRVIAWHKAAGVFHSEVTVPDTGTANVTIRVPVDEEPRP